MQEQRRWTRLGAEEPYFAVCTEPRYRLGSMGQADLSAFFESGEREMAATLATVRRLHHPAFRPSRALDFGCGVGRLTIPLARQSERAVGVDLSAPMLSEAAKNCAARGVANVQFLTTDEFMRDGSAGGFDFAHSFIVFQHIEPRTGLRITDRILRALHGGGVAALHYTIATDIGPLRKAIYEARRWFPPANYLANLVNGRPALEPMVLMHCYDEGELSRLFASHGCTAFHTEAIGHGGYRGIVFFLVKRKEQP